VSVTSSPKVTCSARSSWCVGISTGRRPASSERSATRADWLAERTELKVATASTNVPPAVASDEIVTQSAIGDRAGTSAGAGDGAAEPRRCREAARASER
jgi:hypothetical protein